MDGEAFLDEHPLGGRWALPPGGMGSPCLSEVSGVQGVPLGGLGDHGRRQVDALGRLLGRLGEQRVLESVLLGVEAVGIQGEGVLVGGAWTGIR